MTSGSHRMPADPHIVGGIEESRIDPRPIADDPLQKSGIAAVATSPPAVVRLRACAAGPARRATAG